METWAEIKKQQKEEIEALENNFWDTSMAFEWLKKKEEDPEASLEEFHKAYDQARSKAAVLPQDRYDLSSNNAKPNRKARRAERKKKKKEGK